MLLARAAADYTQFLARMRQGVRMVPRLWTDFVWHTHMLFPREYAADCVYIAGTMVHTEYCIAPTISHNTRAHGHTHQQRHILYTLPRIFTLSV